MNLDAQFKNFQAFRKPSLSKPSYMALTETWLPETKYEQPRFYREKSQMDFSYCKKS